jgi:phage tail tube protein FII
MEAAAIMAIALAHGGTNLRGKVPTITLPDYTLLLLATIISLAN